MFLLNFPIYFCWSDEFFIPIAFFVVGCFSFFASSMIDPDDFTKTRQRQFLQVFGTICCISSLFFLSIIAIDSIKDNSIIQNELKTLVDARTRTLLHSDRNLKTEVVSLLNEIKDNKQESLNLSFDHINDTTINDEFFDDNFCSDNDLVNDTTINIDTFSKKWL